MPTALTVLDAAVRRFGRDAMTDPAALGRALRCAASPPPAHEIDALVRAATESLPRMRAARGRGADLDTALTAATSGATDPAVARWACAVLGTALGDLPRQGTDGGPHPGTTDDHGATRLLAPAATPRRRRVAVRSAIVAGAVLGVSMLVAIPIAVASGTLTGGTQGGVTQGGVTQPAGPDPTSPPATPGPTGTDAPRATTLPAQTYPPGSPLAVFDDPELQKVAEPFLRSPEDDCWAETPEAYEREVVLCATASGYTAAFTRAANPEVVLTIQDAVRNRIGEPGDSGPRGWNFADEAAGTRTETAADAGEGLFSGYTDPTDGSATVYFDQPEASVWVYLWASSTPDADANLAAVRSFWADPTG